MKYLFFFLSLLAIKAGAQTTRAMKWTSATNVNYIYSGEIKNGKPDGKGFAIAEDGSRKVFGDFKNGMLNGKAVVFYSNGAIVMANWTDGFAYGNGVVFQPNNTLLYGNYERGNFDGKMTEITEDGQISIGDYKNGKFNGRMIRAWASGINLTDNIVIDGIRNGQGYQYDADKQKLFEGIWESDEWKNESNGNYPSFMRNKNLFGQTDDKRTMIFSSTEADGNLKDTCFVFLKESGARAFGYFENGNLSSGIRLIKEAIRTIGDFDENGKKKNFCVDYKEGDHFDFGNYKADMLEGNGIHISFLHSDTTVYEGNFREGWLTGNGAKLIATRTIHVGKFEMGELAEGEKIFRIENVSAAKEITGPDGQKINLYPKDVTTAINFLLKEYANDYATINSGTELHDADNDFNPRFHKVMISSYFFPGASISLLGVITNDNKVQQHLGFYAGIGIYKDLESVKKPYDDLCNQLKNCNITSLQKGKVLKLAPKIKPLLKENFESGALISSFSVPVYDAKKTRLVIEIWVQMNYKNGYELVLAIRKDDDSN